MNNPFPYSDSNKRYHTFDYHLKQTFGTKVFKVSLNAGFGCPNRDGTKGYGGCTFCSGTGSGDFAGNPDVSLKEQFDTVSKS
ncbi:MAG: TIGR01212 family radical SAM protein, partial [Oscillospiraceae bacterium]